MEELADVRDIIESGREKDEVPFLAGGARDDGDDDEEEGLEIVD